MPLRSDWSEKPCPIARSLDVVGDPWTLLIIRQALSGVRRYEDFRAGTGAADNVLSHRLRDLVEAGLLRRVPCAQGRRGQQEYLLTPAGADLLPVLNALVIWGEQHRPHPEPGIRMDVVHRSCGAVSTSPDVCSGCGEPMPADQVAWRKSWQPRDVPLVGAS